jgi:hypothetical protein
LKPAVVFREGGAVLASGLYNTTLVVVITIEEKLLLMLVVIFVYQSKR